MVNVRYTDLVGAILLSRSKKIIGSNILEAYILSVTFMKMVIFHRII